MRLSLSLSAAALVLTAAAVPALANPQAKADEIHAALVQAGCRATPGFKAAMDRSADQDPNLHAEAVVLLMNQGRIYLDANGKWRAKGGGCK